MLDVQEVAIHAAEHRLAVPAAAQGDGNGAADDVLILPACGDVQGIEPLANVIIQRVKTSEERVLGGDVSWSAMVDGANQSVHLTTAGQLLAQHRALHRLQVDLVLV